MKKRNNIFTDGSKQKEKNGRGIYIQKGQENWYHSIKANNEACIASIELKAIEIAMKMVEELKMERPTIYMDSLTSCNILKKAKDEEEIEETIYNIIEIGNRLKAKMWWIAAHVGIHGNEYADRLAKEGTISNITTENKIRLVDAYERYKIEMIKKTKIWYEEQCQNKGEKFQAFQKKIEMIPWEKDIDINPEEVRTINKLLTGHDLSPFWLVKMKLVEYPRNMDKRKR